MAQDFQEILDKADERRGASLVNSARLSEAHFALSAGYQLTSRESSTSHEIMLIFGNSIDEAEHVKIIFQTGEFPHLCIIVHRVF